MVAAISKFLFLLFASKGEMAADFLPQVAITLSLGPQRDIVTEVMKNVVK